MVIYSCGFHNNLEEGLQFFQAQPLSVKESPIVVTSLLFLYSLCNQYEDIKSMDRTRLPRDTTVYNALVLAAGQHFDSETILEVLDEMDELGISKNYATYTFVIDGLGRALRFDDLKLFYEKHKSTFQSLPIDSLRHFYTLFFAHKYFSRTPVKE